MPSPAATPSTCGRPRRRRRDQSRSGRARSAISGVLPVPPAHRPFYARRAGRIANRSVDHGSPPQTQRIGRCRRPVAAQTFADQEYGGPFDPGCTPTMRSAAREDVPVFDDQTVGSPKPTSKLALRWSGRLHNRFQMWRAWWSCSEQLPNNGAPMAKMTLLAQRAWRALMVAAEQDVLDGGAGPSPVPTGRVPHAPPRDGSTTARPAPAGTTGSRLSETPTA
jgi:hypothetical protein